MSNDEPYGIELMDATERRVHALHVSLQQFLKAEQDFRAAEEAMREARRRVGLRSTDLARALPHNKHRHDVMVTTDEGMIYRITYSAEGAECPVSVTVLHPAEGGEAALFLPVKAIRTAVEARRRAYHAEQCAYHAARAEDVADTTAESGEEEKDWGQDDPD
jgi:hypothetical protein